MKTSRVDMHERRKAAQYRKQQAVHEMQKDFEERVPNCASAPWDGPFLHTALRFELANRHILSELKGREHSEWKKRLDALEVALWEARDGNRERRFAAAKHFCEAADEALKMFPAAIREKYVCDFRNAKESVCRLLARTDIWPKSYDPLGK